MAEPLSDRSRSTNGRTPLVPTRPSPADVSEEDYRDRFGDDLQNVLDLNTWNTRDLASEYDRIEREVCEAVQQETGHQKRIRERVFPELCNPARAPKGGGVFEAKRDLLARIHSGLLFNGGVEACDGTIHVHDTLPLTICQAGVSLVSYCGSEGTWRQQLFRRDLRRKGGDPTEDMLELLRRRSERGALNHDTEQDFLGTLVRRAIMSYAERAVLVERSKAVWKMGHGPPVPYELLTGAGIFELMVASMNVLRGLIETHQKFVFVSSEPRELLLLSIGQALRPMEYAIVYSLKERLETWLHQERFAVDASRSADWDGERLKASQWIPRFLERVASRVVIGVYRATLYAPAQVFYAHEDHADLAAHIVLADSALQEHRGFPLLIDLADHVCRAVFGSTLQTMTNAAYAAAGAQSRYFSERMTRD